MLISLFLLIFRYMNILLLPVAFGHGLIRCSLFQVTVSAILRSVNNEEVLHMVSTVILFISIHL